jgi:hypothetical protein
MLSLREIEEGACYISDETRIFVAWEMLYYASKIFWTCDTLKILDRAKSLYNYAFVAGENNKFGELVELLQQVENPIIDTVRIVICFENYFKALLLLNKYAIHQMNLDICRNEFSQFVFGQNKQLLQRSTPILISDIKQAENNDPWSMEPLRILNNQTISISTLLKNQKYRAVYSKGNKSDKKLFPILKSLNSTRNSLHFLNVDYIAGGKLQINDLVFLRDYVSTHIDTWGGNFYRDNKDLIGIGKTQIEHLDLD